MTQITNTQLLSEITHIKERLEKVEHAVDGKNGGTIATLIRHVSDLDARLTKFEETVSVTLKIGGAILAILSFCMPLISLVIQHFWH